MKCITSQQTLDRHWQYFNHSFNFILWLFGYSLMLVADELPTWKAAVPMTSQSKHRSASPLVMSSEHTLAPTIVLRYTLCVKKLISFSVDVTTPNIDQFSWFFHQQTCIAVPVLAVTGHFRFNRSRSPHYFVKAARKLAIMWKSYCDELKIQATASTRMRYGDNFN